MVQNQLTDYISSQIKLGVSRDAVKLALTGAGWTEVDVEDTLKKVESTAKVAAAIVATLPTTSAKPASSSPASVSMGSAQKSAEPQSIRVSDLISASGSAVSFSSGPAASQNKAIVQKNQPVEPVKMKMSGGGIGGGPKQASASKAGLIIKIVGVVLILGFGGLAGFLYFQNNDLAGKVTTLNGASADVTSRVALLGAQVQALTASNTALMAEAASTTAENATLLINLSFIVVPPGSSSSATSSQKVSISGMLTAGKASYTLTTIYGVAILVQNAKDAKVVAALTPLANSTSSVQIELTGTHVLGSQYITVTAVNGTSL